MVGQLIGLLVPITFILTVGGVILLRPLSKRLGDLIDAMTAEKRNPDSAESSLARIHQSLDSIHERLTLLEERQDFTDQLLQRRPAADAGRLGPSAQSTSGESTAEERSAPRRSVPAAGPSRRDPGPAA